MKVTEMMDEIIEDMKNKTPEELFECLYNNSEHFKNAFDKALKEVKEDDIGKN